jgi:hypothetical protein
MILHLLHFIKTLLSVHTGEGYNMLSGKTQYYNAVRKESFKTINSVTFCAGTKGRQLWVGGLGWDD